MTPLEMADLALRTPVINSSPLPRYSYQNLDYGMTIGIAQTHAGRLWACWVGGGDSPKAFFLLASSDDDGKTWSEPRFVVDMHSQELPAPMSTLVGNLWTDPAGRLWWFLGQSMGQYDGRAGVWASVCSNPDAEAPAWSEPVRIWHGYTLNKPIVLRDGTWLLPVSLWDRRYITQPFNELFHELDDQRMAHVFASVDQGKTWTRRGGVLIPDSEFDEHIMIERADGSIYLTARTRSNGIWSSVSKNGGASWSTPEYSGISNCSARHFMIKLKSGRVLLVKHGEKIDSNPGERSHLSAFLSEDDGKSWLGGLLLDERTGISYPDGFQSDDGYIYVSYDRNRATDGEILMARFTEDDICSGRFGASRSEAKKLISRPLGIRGT